jgi:hypothetical protein
MKKPCLWVPAFIAGMLLIAGCFRNERTDRISPSNVLGYKPIYSKNPVTTDVSFKTNQPVQHAGKIYLYNKYIFQVDNGTGIHIIDAAIPSQASRSGFIQVDGCQEISISGHYLYTNNMADLIVIDIADYTHPVLVKRMTHTFNFSADQTELPPGKGYFECPDASKGKVVGWYQDTLAQATCLY